MNIEEAMVEHLLNYPGLKALINDKIYPEEIPQKTKLPAVFWIKVSDNKDHFLDGQCKTERPIYQFTAQANSKGAVKPVAEQIKKALCDYQGILHGVEVQKIELQNEFSSMEKNGDGTVRIFYEDLEFEITFVKE
jgi:hypothetical protein